jgi:hypothetical protein
MKELSATLAHLKRALQNPRLGDAQRERLRKGLRELERQKRGGKLDREKVFRATELISAVLLEVLAASTSSDDSQGSNATRRAR